MSTSRSYRTGLKTTISFAVCFVLVVAGLLVALRLSHYSKDYSKGGTARLEIKSKEKSRIFEGEVPEGMTLLEALQASAAAGNIDFKYSMDGETINIHTLDSLDLKDNPGSIVLYLNSSQVELSKIREMTIKPGDLIVIYEN